MTVSLVQNFYKQTVTTPWTVGTGNFYVSQKPSVTSGFLVISPNSESLREIVSFSAVGTDGGGDYVTVSARGLGGTTEQAHGAGEKVFMNITAQHIEQIKQAIEDINNAGALNASTTVKGVARLTASPNVSLGNPTITIASPAVVTLTAHGLTENDEIQFTTTGALPTGIVSGTTYYVIGTGLTANTFQFSATFGGSAVNTSGSQSGTHTLTRVTPRAVSENDSRIPTSDILAALAGGSDFGTPNSGNKFATENFIDNNQKIDVFTANGTWTKPTNAKFVEVLVIGAGGGGGGGGVHTADSAQGGGGGGGGGISIAKFPASLLTATVAITLGVGGNGGNGAVATSSTAGSNGSAGTGSSFGAYLTANGGAAGNGGQNGGGVGGAGGAGLTYTGTSGGAGGIGSGSGTGGTASTISCTGGGGGGACNSGNSRGTGGTGGALTPYLTRAGGTGGATTPTAGGNGNSPTGGEFSGGTGAGGGGGNQNATGANGGVGGYGGGGGGGGGCHRSAGTVTAGTGGQGGQGFVAVISYL
jgi:hypothetical protein